MNYIEYKKIKRYEELQASIKLAEKELNELKREFISIGGGESESHIVVIKDNFRETVASVDILESDHTTVSM